MSDYDPICATCGKPRSNHPYRHPFKGPSRDDRIEALTAKLAEVEAERDALLESGLAAYFAGSGDTKARERDAYRRGFKAALEKATTKIHAEGIRRAKGWMPYDQSKSEMLLDIAEAIRAIPLPDIEKEPT